LRGQNNTFPSKHEGGILPLSVLKNYFKHSNLKVAFIS